MHHSRKGSLKAKFKETHDEDTDSDESVVIGREEDQYKHSSKDELCESKFPNEIVVPRLPGQETDDQEDG
jgi:hypothetical protein